MGFIIKYESYDTLDANSLLAVYTGIADDVIVADPPEAWECFLKNPNTCEPKELMVIKDYLWELIPDDWKDTKPEGIKPKRVRRVTRKRKKKSKVSKPKPKPTGVRRKRGVITSLTYTDRNPLNPGTQEGAAFQLAIRDMGVTLTEYADVLRENDIVRVPDVYFKYAMPVYRLKEKSSGRPVLLPDNLSIKKTGEYRNGYAVYKMWDSEKKDWY